MKTLEFDPHLNMDYVSLILVGCGGTGSALATIIGRTLFHMKANRIATPKRILLVDDDLVEAKNVGRQGFVAAEIGCYKAEVLAQRLSMGFGLKVQYLCEKFDASMTEYEASSTIILGAVDNHLARKAIADAKAIWIDSGNHKSAGQVVIGTTSEIKDMRYILNSLDAKSTSVTQLPNAAVVFPALLEAEKEERQLSCAELLELNQQHLLINNQMAMVAGQYLYKLLMREPIRTHYTYIDMDYLTMRSEMITLEHLKQFAFQSAEVA